MTVTITLNSIDEDWNDCYFKDKEEIITKDKILAKRNRRIEKENVGRQNKIYELQSTKRWQEEKQKQEETEITKKRRNQGDRKNRRLLLKAEGSYQ